MRMRFASGLIVGLLLASLTIIASSGIQGPSSSGPSAPTGGLPQFTSTATETITSSSTTTAAAAVISPAPVSNITRSSGFTGNGLSSTASQSAASLQLTSTGRPPSSLAVIVNEPVQSLILLLPIALAIALGLVIRRTSAPRD